MIATDSLAPDKPDERMVKVAAAQYPIEPHHDFQSWAVKLAEWVDGAVANGAQLLVFPEYAGMEVAGIDFKAAATLTGSLELVVELGEEIDEAHRHLAMMHKVTILGGSRPCRDVRGRIVNRARLFLPDGTSAFQDKIVMTRFEREHWHVSGGDAINVIDTPLGRVGISICYDAEFPLIARAQAEAGAELILVPSATDTVQGYWRVRLGAQARALENQCYVIQAPTVGLAPWLPAMDVNHGSSAIYGPPDGNTPDNGVFAIGELDKSQWLFADIDLNDVARWRRDGTVLPYLHWPEQNAVRSRAG